MLNIYLCEHCKNVAIKLVDKGVPLVCCGEKMTALVPMQSDGALEKHLPVLAFDEDTLTVTVGEVLHPMLENHYINFVVVELVDGYLIKHLSPASQPVEWCRCVRPGSCQGQRTGSAAVPSSPPGSRLR